VSAQYLYFDTNGNSVNDVGDVLSPVGTTHADIWLNTGLNRDGSPASCADLGLISYELIVTAVGGTVTWGTYSNVLPGGTVYPAFTASSATEFHVGVLRPGAAVPGLYQLGTLDVDVASGSPCLQFSESSALSPCYATAFGSRCPGSRFDNTARLGSDWLNSDGTCQVLEPGTVSGSVTASCPSSGTGLLGVTVDAYQVGSGDLVGSAITNNAGSYSIPGLPPGEYVITILPPLGYTAATEEIHVTVSSGQTVNANFNLGCQQIAASPKTIGYWKHQVAVALGGNGQFQVDPTTLCRYLDMVESHFNNNALNQVIIYQPLAGATCEQKFETAKVILNLTGSVAMIDRARQQLMALLLNVASGYISQTAAISSDGATVTQAITYSDNLIDAGGANVERAKTIADTINNGQQVPAGMIPLGTQKIAYALQRNRIQFRATPNIGTQEWTFRFVAEKPGEATIRVYDLAGRRIATVLDQTIGAGSHSVRWDGRADWGERLASGLYLARLSTASGAATVKLLHLHP
jgi:hypothetical protein